MDWKERRDSYFELAKNFPEQFPDQFVYPRSTYASWNNFFLQFYTSEACDKVISNLESNNRSTDSRMESWIVRMLKNQEKSKHGDPFFLLLAKNSVGMFETVTYVGVLFFDMNDSRKNFPVALRFPEIAEGDRATYPVFSVFGWDVENGYLFELSETIR